ncbi:AGE family epimerase/isomerase [Bosea sp. (in: a-proteobacteria)]|jgi:mannose/cellobiose epimerase-like protein (N-acyl-D-glucosamine 2-epimerase family)|uniref:AGE family epimerase/isomerase n=1 Tax=Bosea sp. (in: a-proteobacteria) TaxID=1871050 RepID=UPI002DDCCC22|nr:AGE family epimerase/isomerase [Bosea sp. (in: a-proteobacteria)]HEV2509540.1 AGE family epimerase/isomerase [Bosea sp. (in: a-proteobacteria)]
MSNPVPDDLQSWLTTALLPGWIARAFDPARPGFVEYLEPDGTPEASDLRTTLVTARLTYVFSHAHLLGVPGALAAARHGLAFLTHVCRGADGRFVHSCTTHGEVVDGKTDFYDLAFVLFALGWFAKATGETNVLTIAGEVMDFLDSELAHPAGGFGEDTLGTQPRRQNPHMHLLEACHALAAVSPDPRWLATANGLVQLMRGRMLDADGTLGEFFDEGWTAFPGPRGLIREPGHHFEWTWLLYHHERLTGSSGARETARKLHAFGERQVNASANPSRLVVNEVDPTGRVLNGAALLWPQTEYLKALVARIEFESDADAAALLDRHLHLMFRHFVDRESGIWVNQLDDRGLPISERVPVRVLYHLVLALAEVCRVTKGGVPS